MISIEQVLEIIFECIDEFNKQELSLEPLMKEKDEVIFGKNGKLDSLGLVNIIVTVEEKVEDKTGRSIVLADERAMSQEQSPFRTVETLSEYIVMLLNDNSDE